MRLETATPRTWLLAAVAGWAVAAWLLAVAGMGGRTGMLPEDASLVQPLPQLRPAPPERLGPLPQYAEIGARPLFSDDRRPQPFSLQAEGDEEEPANTFDYVLTSVLITPKLQMAIVQPSDGGNSVRIKLDEAANEIPDWRLVELHPRGAVFEGPGGQKSLDLRVYDGTGGEAPTAVRTARNAEAGEELPAPPQPKPVAAKPQKPRPQPQPPETPEATANVAESADDANADANAKAQMDAIRRRIEQRRAQLRQQAQGQSPPVKNP